ncbi:MAG: 3-phosphoshikimate 1-carboxyvinyltransferase [Bacillota bacterium]|nr:3-phosphoshikimate 1-carboxyvinyltransferase [Bacillota bacterium]
MKLRVKKARQGLKGIVSVPGDKSISHRAVLWGALAEGRTEIVNFLPSEDCLCTVKACQALGVPIHLLSPSHLVVEGVGLEGLQEPSDVIDAGNSGTTLRLLTGLLAGQEFYAVLTGDASLRRRPMDRVVEPLRAMGASIDGRQGGSRAPLSIRGRRPLRGLSYALPVASAQVKSALLLAGLYAREPVSVTEPLLSRDHSERIFALFGCPLERNGLTVTLRPGRAWKGRPVSVPGDFSSAAFLIAAALLVEGSEVTIAGVGVNPTRTGLLEVIASMGGKVEVNPAAEKEDWEPRADLRISFSPLRGTQVGGPLIPRLIDEIPILAVLALAARGTTVVRDAAELRVKESDRIAVLCQELGRLGGRLTPLPDGLVIEGGSPLKGAATYSHGDHRIAMALAVAGLLAEGETTVDGFQCVATSYPNFVATLQELAPGCAALVEEEATHGGQG